MFDILFSLTKGFFLGSTVYVLGSVLDNFVSYSSKFQLMQEKTSLLIEADKYVQINLLCLSPIVYSFVDYFILSYKSFNLFEFVPLLLIQNVGYFISHKTMHTVTWIYTIHAFHHKFDNILLPSIANAVSIYEFIFAYLFPIIFGSYLIKPSEISFLSAVGIISLFNLLIHTNELNDFKWISFLVSPKKHSIHHKQKNKFYSAPLLDIDYFYNKITQSFYHEKK
jgi:sterol desaturase/sphingolipid hydroxylase (fatty acid hydroxylase superfamily)